ncbi:MAG: exodeoxyribonuclease VII large subunit [Lachnospiraceae bacterium]|nr:exodeoxyribonuclease VII large subunit [Lachnospiraceae bacterium]
MKQNVYSVSQINSYIKNMFTQDFLCSSILIKGELSNVKYHGSGHIYFTLKDSGAAISCVMFAGNRSGLDFRMVDGLQVIVGGSIDVYERDGKYQLYARQIEQAGGGALYEQYEKLKKELEEMGMFDACYKQPIPRYVKRLGVVTASTGAAVRDIINVAKRRNPYIEIILYPAIVQGEYAVPSIVEGIRTLDTEGVDVMIVGRGGGSMEDLWAFNSREVAQAVFDCQVPVISAVGHETDTTIIDYVSDLRAPTPSAGAELAVCDMEEVLRRIAQLKRSLADAMLARCARERMRTENFSLKLKTVSPQAIMKEHRMRILSMEEEIVRAMESRLLFKRNELALYAAKLESLSPLAKLKQGYAYVTTSDDTTLTDVNQITPGDTLTIYLRNGSVEAQATRVDRRAE